MRFEPHSEKQEQAIFSQTPITVLATGIQFGKSRAGAARIKLAMHRYTSPKDNFLVVAPTYKIMQQATLPAIKPFLDGCGEFVKSEARFETHWGSNIWFRTGTDPNSVVGLTDVRSIWGDEAGLFSLYFWENILARAAFREAQIALTTSPYTLNWLYRELILPKMRDPSVRPDALLIQAESRENPHFPIESWHAAQKRMDARRFRAMFGGAWERPAGLVYDCWDDTENQCEPFALPDGTRFYAGLDWGFTEPFALNVRALTPAGAQYGVSQVYKSGLAPRDVVTLVCDKVRVWGIEKIACDPSQPGMIEELNRAFVKERLACVAIAADNDIAVGIGRHYELIRLRQYRVFRGACPYLLDELATYHYPAPKDAAADAHVRDQKPVSQNDHALDADRYCTMMLWKASTRVAPRVPQDEARSNLIAVPEVGQPRRRRAPHVPGQGLFTT